MHDRRDAGVEHRRVGGAVSGRTPVRPVASVESRSSISARTTSRSTSGPEPAACERTRLRCSCARRSDRDVRASPARRTRSRRRSAARVVRRARRSRRGCGAIAASASAASTTPAPSRATATTSAGSSGPMPTVTGAGRRVLLMTPSQPRRHAPRASSRTDDSVSDPRQARWAAVPAGPGGRAVLQLLSRLARHAAPLPAAAIARELGLPRSTVYHLLAVLVRRRLRRAPAGGAALRARRRRLRARHRLPAAGAARAAGASGARPAGRRAGPERAPRRAARARGALRGRGARAGPAAAGHRRRRPAARAPDRERARDARGTAAAQVRALFPGRERLRRPARRRAGVAVGAAARAHRRPARGYAEEDGEVTPGFASVAAACATTPAIRWRGSPSPIRSATSWTPTDLSSPGRWRSRRQS